MELTHCQLNLVPISLSKCNWENNNKQRTFTKRFFLCSSLSLCPGSLSLTFIIFVFYLYAWNIGLEYAQKTVYLDVNVNVKHLLKEKKYVRHLVIAHLDHPIVSLKVGTHCFFHSLYNYFFGNGSSILSIPILEHNNICHICYYIFLYVYNIYIGVFRIGPELIIGHEGLEWN